MATFRILLTESYKIADLQHNITTGEWLPRPNLPQVPVELRSFYFINDSNVDGGFLLCMKDDIALYKEEFNGLRFVPIRHFQTAMESGCFDIDDAFIEFIEFCGDIQDKHSDNIILGFEF